MRRVRRSAPRSIAANLARGAVAGVAAALANQLFEQAWSALKLPPTDHERADPPTETLADLAFEAATGARLADASRVVAGKAVHYAMGAALGASYALIARRWPSVAAGGGTAYGLAVWVIVEEVGLAMVGLKPPPTEVEPAEHVLAANSHLVFGVALDLCVTRLAGEHRLLRSRSGHRAGRLETHGEPAAIC